MLDLVSLPRTEVVVNAHESKGPLEWWRHSLGQGGINSLPLPPRVRAGVARLRPRLIRVFIQEHFDLYPDHGRFDWRKIDRFMDALAETGAKVVAAITIKPPALFPKVDHGIWEPADVAEWQHVIHQLVRRYSVEKPVVTHWEVGNETDIGEDGGSPYLIPDPRDYARFYEVTTRPILAACSSAKVGGPAACWVENEPLPGFVSACRASGARLDFISWHLYHDDAGRHAAGVGIAQRLLSDFPPPRPEMMVTEWNKSFDPVSAEDLAFVPRRAASVAAAVIAMLDAGLDWSFYYHIWDQVFYPDPFRPFFSGKGVRNMEVHWNEAPHRFGLFGVEGEVRPQYFVYQMLGRLGDERAAADSDHPSVRVLAGRAERSAAALIANYQPQERRDTVVTVRFAGLRPGPRLLTVHRIDSARRWSPEDLELIPVERREVYASEEFRCSLYLPADTVAMVRLDEGAGVE